MRIAIYLPDIPQNVGGILRTAACLGVGVDIIEPCGFPFDIKRIRQAALDYIDLVEMKRHPSWEDFYANKPQHARLVLLSTKGATPLYDFQFQANDILLFGRESAGVPEFVHARADARVVIPMHGSARSLNVGVSVAIVTAEALRQTGLLHHHPVDDGINTKGEKS